MDLLKYNQLKANKSTCPFCGEEIYYPYMYLNKPFGTREIYTTCVTECLNCNIEIEVRLDQYYNIIEASVTPFEPVRRWFI